MPWLLTSIYDTAPLRETLAELVDPQRAQRRRPAGDRRRDQRRHRRDGVLPPRAAPAASPSSTSPPAAASRRASRRPRSTSTATGTAACSPTPRSARRSTRWSRRRAATATWSANSIVVELFPMRAALPHTCTTCCSGWSSCSTRAGSPSKELLRQDQRRGRPDARGRRRRCPPTATSATTRPTAGCAPTARSTTSTSSPRACPRAVQRRRLLAGVDRGPDPGGLRRRHGAGDRQPPGAGAADRDGRGAGARVTPRPRSGGTLRRPVRGGVRACPGRLRTRRRSTSACPP